MRKCKKCKVEKSESEFPLWAGKPGAKCADCRQPVGRQSADGSVKKKKPKLTKAIAPPATELALAFPAGFGFDANTRGDVIQIDQWPAEGEGDAVSIVLSRAEFATIAAHFGTWAGA